MAGVLPGTIQIADAPPAPVPTGGPFPGDPVGDFQHILEHIVGLTTSNQRDRVTINAGVQTVDDLLFIDQESLLSVLPTNTN